MVLPRPTWKAAAVVAALATACAAGTHPAAPGSDAEVRGTAQPVRFVDQGPTDGGVWFLTVTKHRRPPVERLLGRDHPEVVTEEAVSSFDADGAFRTSQDVARDVATRFDPGGRVVLAAGLAAAPRLHPGDQLVAVDGTPITGVREAAGLLRRWESRGDGPVVLTILRDGLHQHVRIDRDALDRGLALPLVRLPAEPHAEIGDVRGGEFRGASAGLAFAIALLDRASGGTLLAGRSVAASGVLVDTLGRVVEVASVDAKAAAAAAAGAEVLFVSEANVDDVPDDLDVTVVGVDDVREAVRWLCSHPRGHDCGALAVADDLRWDGRL